jgi:CelD/BcsL family acetyltransferase involved in cellulose biosynthesis
VATASSTAAAAGLVVVPPNDDRWLRLARDHPDALPFHRPEWLDVLAGCYGFRPFVAALGGADGELAGGLPLMEVRDPVRGRRWIGLPFTDRCPPLLTEPGLAGTLAAQLGALAAASGVRSVEVRAPFAGGGLSAAPVAVTHELDLEPGADAVERGFSSMTRRNTRKARREGLELRVADTESDLTKVFYELHARTRRRLGVPVQPVRFFRALWRLGLDRGLGHELIVLHRGRPVAAAVFLHAAPTVVYKYGASDERAWAHRPNNLLFDEAIRAACERGAASLDFGRSDFEDEGLRAFKAGWGAREEPLVYAATRPAAEPGPPSLAGRLGSSAIRRSPMWFGRLVGSALYRYAA